MLLDDYAYIGYESQKAAMDALAEQRKLRILSLPTGQGLLVKPPSGGWLFWRCIDHDSLEKCPICGGREFQANRPCCGTT